MRSARRFSLYVVEIKLEDRDGESTFKRSQRIASALRAQGVTCVCETARVNRSRSRRRIDGARRLRSFGCDRPRSAGFNWIDTFEMLIVTLTNLTAKR